MITIKPKVHGSQRHPTIPTSRALLACDVFKIATFVREGPAFLNVIFEKFGVRCGVFFVAGGLGFGSFVALSPSILHAHPHLHVRCDATGVGNSVVVSHEPVLCLVPFVTWNSWNDFLAPFLIPHSAITNIEHPSGELISSLLYHHHSSVWGSGQTHLAQEKRMAASTSRSLTHAC